MDQQMQDAIVEAMRPLVKDQDRMDWFAGVLASDNPCAAWIAGPPQDEEEAR